MGRRREAAETAVRALPTGGMPFPKQDIPLPEDFAAMAGWSGRGLQEPRPDEADPARHVEQIQRYVDMGFTEIHIHKVGRNQWEFIDDVRARGPAGAASRLIGPGAGRPSLGNTWHMAWKLVGVPAGIVGGEKAAA